MPEKMIIVECALSDCLYHVTKPERPDAVYCKHPDKGEDRYYNTVPCPLYRLDWHKKATSEKDPAKDFLRLIRRH